MYSIINLIHKAVAAPFRKLGQWWNQASLKGYLQRKGVRFENDIRLNGRTLLNISKEAHVSIGRSFICNGGGTGIDAGIDSMIIVAKNATLTIGNGSGISNTSIHCYDSITIGDHVNIGAGTKRLPLHPLAGPRGPRAGHPQQEDGSREHRQLRVHRHPVPHRKGREHWRPLHRGSRQCGGEGHPPRPNMGRQPCTFHQKRRITSTHHHSWEKAGKCLIFVLTRFEAKPR